MVKQPGCVLLIEDDFYAMFEETLINIQQEIGRDHKPSSCISCNACSITTCDPTRVTKKTITTHPQNWINHAVRHQTDWTTDRLGVRLTTHTTYACIIREQRVSGLICFQIGQSIPKFCKAECVSSPPVCHAASAVLIPIWIIIPICHCLFPHPLQFPSVPFLRQPPHRYSTSQLLQCPVSYSFVFFSPPPFVVPRMPIWPFSEFHPASSALVVVF